MSEELKSDLELHRRFAKQFFNETWELLDKPDRSADEDLRMVLLAHASRLHWEYAGTARNRSVGEWQISRVYSILGRQELALYHAQNSLRTAIGQNLQPFVLGYSYEAMARAYAVSGDQSAGEYLAKAEGLLKEVDDLQDRALLESDLAAIKNLLKN